MQDRQAQQLRNRISKDIPDCLFTDYWDVFVLKHQHPANVVLHVIGIGIFYGLLCAAMVTHNAWLLCGWPLAQASGLIGHLLFERSHIDLQDAVFSWRASYCLGRMLWRILLGKYGEDIRHGQELLSSYYRSAER